MTPPAMAAATDASLAPAGARLADDVRRSLARLPRQLPSRYLYDALGSALFDAICELPWYRVTRAETRLLRTHGPALWADLEPLDRVIELGTGDGRKLATLLSLRPRRLPPLRVDLVDISEAAIESAAAALAKLPGTRIVRHHATYEAGIGEASGRERRGRALVLFLGSNIGNFDPVAADALLRRVRGALLPGDALLLGVDLVKPERELLLAYDDPLGVTRAFNLNVLLRMNRELDADFDPAWFEHRAVWNPQPSRVEMHLVSTRSQAVRIPGAGIELPLQPSEPIWTESSYKYRTADVFRLIERAGFDANALWEDSPARFALALCKVPSA